MTRAHQTHLPANLPPRGLSREEAAAYIGLSAGTFDKLVGEGRMPKPIHVRGRRLWDSRALDQSFDALGDNAESVEDPWSDGA